MQIIVGTGLLLLAIGLAIPIGFALGITGVVALSFQIPYAAISGLLSKVVHGTTANYVLLALPLFVLMAEFLASGGIARDLLLACHRMLRRVRGGLAMACIFAGVLHAAATGSSGASAASLARASFPAMMSAGYAPSFAAGTIAIAGTLAMMIPPSIAFILYGLMTETSIGKLFLAGIVPGLLTALGYLLTISIVLRLKPELGPKTVKGSEVVATEEGHETPRVWPMLLLLVIVIGGLYSGFATPTEISAIGAVGAFLIAVHHRRMTKQNFAEALGATLKITTMVVIIMIGAHVFGYFISFSRATEQLLAWIAASELSPTSVMIFLVLCYIVLGMFMDQAAILILTAPITTPLMVGLGYDPIWWGVIIIKTAEIGMLTPPLGMVVFITSAATKTDLKSCYVGVIPYLIAEFAILALLMAFPILTLWMTQ